MKTQGNTKCYVKKRQQKCEVLKNYVYVPIILGWKKVFEPMINPIIV